MYNWLHKMVYTKYYENIRRKKNILDILDIRKIGLVEIDKDILGFLLRFSKKNNIINIYIQMLFGSFSL